MRCEGAENPPCRRCRHAGLECLFEKPQREASLTGEAGLEYVAFWAHRTAADVPQAHSESREPCRRNSADSECYPEYAGRDCSSSPWGIAFPRSLTVGISSELRSPIPECALDGIAEHLNPNCRCSPATTDGRHCTHSYAWW